MREVFAILVLLNASAAFAGQTTLEVNPGEGGAAYTADYSQAINLSARLRDDDGEPIGGERVTFELSRDSDPDGTRFVIADPITAADGVATARLTLVDGRHGGQSFIAGVPGGGDQGEPYTVVARFLGADPSECAPADAGPIADAGAVPLCSSDDDNALFVTVEVPQITLEPGNEVALGETITLISVLVDPNGDAPEAGTDVDGSDERPIAGASISFFYDLDGNARPSLDELLGRSDTNGDGIATFEFPADPAFVTAANVEDGLHVQYGGDDRFALAGASQNLIVTPGLPDAARTIVSATPEVAPANGFARIELQATLVDEFNNTYSEDDQAFIVDFTSDIGVLEDTAERDPIDGTYRQTLRAPLEAGTATIQVVVDGAAGSTTSVEFEAAGCTCGSTRAGGAPVVVAFAALIVLVLRRRR